MQYDEAYALKLEILNAIDPADVVTPDRMPVRVYVDETIDLHNHCKEDRALLEARNLPWEVAEDLENRAKVLYHAQLQWEANRFAHQEAEALWAKRYPEACDLRRDLIEECRFAFHGKDKLLKRVSAIAENRDQLGIIGDLDALSMLAKANEALVTAAGVDMLVFEDAEQVCGELTTLRGLAREERRKASSYKDMRDRAYTHCDEAVVLVRRVGKHALRRDKKRLAGYASQFLRSKWKSDSVEPDQVPAEPIDQDPIDEPGTVPVVEPASEPGGDPVVDDGREAAA